MASHCIVYLQTSAAGVIQCYHLYHQCNVMHHIMVHNGTIVQLCWTFKVSSAPHNAVWRHQKCKDSLTWLGLLLKTYSHGYVIQLIHSQRHFKFSIIFGLYLCSIFQYTNIITNGMVLPGYFHESLFTRLWASLYWPEPGAPQPLQPLCTHRLPDFMCKDI